jgi:signal transduction histidine kinase/ligand-binding sensor domain-containing protein
MLRQQALRAAFLYSFVALTLFGLDASKPLSSYGRQTWRTDNGLPQNTVHAILQSHEGNIWLATEGGLVRFDGVRFATFDPQNTPALRSNNVRGLVEDGDRNLWIATADGLSRFSGKSFSSFTTKDGLPSNDILGIQDQDGVLSIATAEGDCVYRNHLFQPVASRPSAALEKGVLCRYQSRTGVVWLGTESGLLRMANGRVEKFAPSDPLAAATILSVMEDREGDVWVGTDADGVTVLRDQKFAVYGAREGLPSDVVRCAFQDRHGTLWVGTDAGLARFNGHRFLEATPTGLSSQVILSIAADRSGNLLLGTPDGLNVVGVRDVKVLTSADGLPDDFIRFVYTDTDGSLWIATRRGLSHMIGDRIVTYTERDGLGSDLVGAILRDRKANLWVGTYRGLSRLRGSKFITLSQRSVVTALQDDGDGVLWIGTQDAGLSRFKDGQFVRYSNSSGLPSVIYGIAQDADGFLWLTGKTGIYRVSINDLNAAAHGQTAESAVAAYGTMDGLNVTECSDSGHPGLIAARDGTLWFAMRKGIATTHPAKPDEPASELPVVIESVTVDDRVLNPAEAADIAPGHSRIAFEYAGLSYSAPHSVRFKYKLDGFDRNWIDAGTRRVAYYTNIPPATYRFRVLARANDREWGESGAEYSFRLRPHFYQTYWFRLLLVLLIALTIWQVFRWRVRQMRVQYDAVLAERNRIAREIHDTLAQGFVAVSVQLELISQALLTSKETAQKLLAQAQASVQEGLADARRSIWELRSQGAEKDDLASKLSKIAAQVNSANTVSAHLQVFGIRRTLPSNVEDELLKIGQEAVANAVRHADAQHVKIDLSFAPKKLILAVTDDGRGFTPESNGVGPSGHYGLQGMRERARQINARLNVESAPGRGTEVLVEAEIG